MSFVLEYVNMNEFIITIRIEQFEVMTISMVTIEKSERYLHNLSMTIAPPFLLEKVDSFSPYFLRNSTCQGQSR